MGRRLTINSLVEFTEAICSLNVSEAVDEFVQRDVYLFRGQSKTSYQLEPTLARCNKEGRDLCFIERDLIEMAKYRFPDVFRSDLEPVELLALLQHHGIPTRLLDVTENALVALYFACESNENEDGEVIVFHNKEHSVAHFPVINAIADSYRLLNSSGGTLMQFYQSAKIQPYFLEHYSSINDDEKGGRWLVDCCEKPIFIYSSYRSQRQRAQSGRFLLFPNKVIKDGSWFLSCIEPLSKEHDCIPMIIQIPAPCKKQIKKDLKLMGVTQSNLFSDSLDKVCEEIKEVYSKNGRGNAGYI